MDPIPRQVQDHPLRFHDMTSSHPIELEIRGELKREEIPAFIKRLIKKCFRHHSTTRRTSVMSFGVTEATGRGWKVDKREEVDLRCRITNGKAEVVTKIGISDAPNRLEICQPVTLKEMLTFARMFGSMGFFTKVGSKVTRNYKKGRIVVSIAESRSGITYVEIEKMTDRQHENKDLDTLKKLAHDLELTLFPSREVFLELCTRLTKQDDWEFTGNDADLERLQKEIKMFKSDRSAIH